MLRPYHLPCALLLLTAACSSSTSAAVSPITETTRMTENFHTVIENREDPSQRLELTIDVGVGYGWYTDPETSGNSGAFISIVHDGADHEPVPGLSIAGKSVRYKGAELLVGEQSFGALVRPVTIRIEKDGVYVNDELRGQL